MTTPLTPEERLRAALDAPSSKLARAIGKVRFGGTRSGHFFDEDGWSFLVEAVKEAREAFATIDRERRERVDPDLRAALADLDRKWGTRPEDDDLLDPDARTFIAQVRAILAPTPDHTVVGEEREAEITAIAAVIDKATVVGCVRAERDAAALYDAGLRATPRPR